VLHNGSQLVKRKRALLESNPPGIANWKLMETIGEGGGECLCRSHSINLPPPIYEFPNASENSCFRYAPSQMIECCILPTGKERLTAIRGTTLGGRHTIVDAALFWAISRKPRVLCLQKRIYQPNSGWSFCAASRRSLEPAVSSAVKGAAELSGRITNGRCCFKMA
jgi:hypothetical protein